jgi:hypothetical protein
MKTPSRMTGKDYKKSLENLRMKEKALDVRITKRLLELVSIYPNAVIGNVMNDEVKALSLSPNYVNTLPIERRIEYIDRIETSMNNQKQLEIEVS